MDNPLFFPYTAGELSQLPRDQPPLIQAEILEMDVSFSLQQQE